jgi:hypothetical protein
MKNESRLQQTLYAFWGYDICPYVLGGEITEFTEKGNIRAKGYDGMAFKPIAILPGKTGKDALKLIRELQENYRLEEKKLKAQYTIIANGILGLKENK